MNDEITPFRVEITQAQLDDLSSRLTATRWPDEPEGVGWSYGVPVDYLKDLVEHWRTRYDWREWEARLNSYPQFTTTIDGANVHFLHVRSADPDAFPLILTHGWPGSIVEFLEMIEPLSQEFHLVIPSMPNYGLSGPTKDTGWNVRRIATAWAELMRRLGYDRYGAQGGDWGSSVSRDLGIVDAEHVVGVHLNFLITKPDADDVLTDEEQARFSGPDLHQRESFGYAAVQSTRPQTLAYGLHDSPVGQLAWIVEKFREWTDSTDVPEDAVDRDQMLTNVMLYWLTGTAGSSARLYKEAERTWGRVEVSTCPTALAVFPRELGQSIRRIAERTNTIVRWTEFDRGGHFAAMEEPDLLAEDVRAFFRGVR